MITYLVKMMLCSALLLLVYVVLLEKEKMHRFNRCYLLFSLVISFIIPFIQINQQIPIATENVVSDAFNVVTETTLSTVSNTIEQPVQNSNWLANLLFAFYVLVSVILLLRFAKNLYHLWLKISTNQTVFYRGAKLVLLPQNIVSHSFTKYIFIAKEAYENGNIDEAILSHELAHVQQKHSLDILFVEFLRIIFWFNPCIYLYKKAIQLNHEFLADASVIEAFSNVASYQYLLLQQAGKPSSHQLASQFNFSITKKRLIMMNKNTSFTRKMLKQIAILPIIGGLIFVFSSKTIAQDTLKEVTEGISINQPKKEQTVKELTSKELKLVDFWASMSIGYSQTSDELMNEYAMIVIKYKSNSDNKYGIKLSESLNKNEADKKRLAILFKQMSKVQQYKQNVIFCKKLGPSKREVPTETQFNNLKKANVYGIWIDDKRVKNEVLNNYKASDFAQFDISKLYGAAKTGRNYTHQVNMMTKAYYQKYYDETIAKKDEPVMVTRFIKNVTAVTP